MLSLLEIGEQLQALEWKLYLVEEKLLSYNMALDARENKLTPPTGWEGKNPDARQAPKNAVLFSDNIYKRLTVKRNSVEKKVRQLKARISGLTELRRGTEKYLEFSHENKLS